MVCQQLHARKTEGAEAEMDELPFKEDWRDSVAAVGLRRDAVPRYPQPRDAVQGVSYPQGREVHPERLGADGEGPGTS